MLNGQARASHLAAQAKDAGSDTADKISHEAHKAADATKKQLEKITGPAEKVNPAVTVVRSARPAGTLCLLGCSNRGRP